jgi:hypothetical protein
MGPRRHRSPRAGSSSSFLLLGSTGFNPDRFLRLSLPVVQLNEQARANGRRRRIGEKAADWRRKSGGRDWGFGEESRRRIGAGRHEREDWLVGFSPRPKIFPEKSILCVTRTSSVAASVHRFHPRWSQSSWTYLKKHQVIKEFTASNGCSEKWG